MNAGMLLACALATIPMKTSDGAAGLGRGGGGARPLTSTIHVLAWIDGRSWLILDDDTATWQHFDFAAPGRLNCNTGAPEESTFLDGVRWDPVWPDVPDCENRFCGGCFSSTFTGLQTPIPNFDFTPVLVPIHSRYVSRILEYPSAGNGYRVVIEFDDDPPGGADWYEVDLVLGGCGTAPYCSSAPNSSGSAATLSVAGSLGVRANDTQLLASGCPPRSSGFFLYGTHAANLPFADGFLCVSPFHPGLFRVPPTVVVDANGGAQTHLDFTHLPAGGEIVGGSTWCFQFWFRDRAAGGSGANLSDAARVTFCP